MTSEQRHDIFDEAWLPRIKHIPEFAAMRELSPAYHVVEATESPEAVYLTCRDLRTRNFRTRFGELSLVLDREGGVRQFEFHV